MLIGTDVRPQVALVVLILLSSASGRAANALQSDMDRVLRSDPRNSGVLVSVAARELGSTLVYNVTSVAPTNSMSDVFRVFLQFASAEKDRDFKSVELSARGRPKFLIAGSSFKQLGQEYGTQNPIYTIRTFPEKLMKIDGSAAFATWTGGWLRVSSKQMADFNEFHRQWWLMDFAPGAATARLDASNAVAMPTAQEKLVPTSAEVATRPANGQQISSTIVTSTSSVQSKEPMEVPKWLSIFPDSTDRAETPSPGAIDVSYAAAASPDEVVAFYRERFDGEGVAIHIVFNGVGTTIQASRDSESCVIRVAEAGAGAKVSALCADHQAETTTPTTSGVPAPLPAGYRTELSSTKRVGTADVEGWSQARWGMTEQQVLHAFPGRAKVLVGDLENRQFGPTRIATVGIDVEDVGGVPVRALFFFDRAERLDWVRLPTILEHPSFEQFTQMNQALMRTYGVPALFGTSTAGIISPGKFEHGFVSVWMFPRSIVQLSYFPNLILSLRLDKRASQTRESIKATSPNYVWVDAPTSDLLNLQMGLAR